MRSLHIQQNWSDKDRYAREDWFDRNIDRLIASRESVRAVIAEYARVIAETGAHDARRFDPATYTADMMESLDHTLAPEVQDWLDSLPEQSQ